MVTPSPGPHSDQNILVSDIISSRNQGLEAINWFDFYVQLFLVIGILISRSWTKIIISVLPSTNRWWTIIVPIAGSNYILRFSAFTFLLQLAPAIHSH